MRVSIFAVALLSLTPSTSMLAQTPAQPAQATTEFDGEWSIVWVCADYRNGKGFTNRLSMLVKAGFARAKWGTDGQPNSMTMTGQIHSDGSATLVLNGLTGSPKYNIGSENEGLPYGYAVRANFAGKKGFGTRVGERPCTFTFAKQ